MSNVITSISELRAIVKSWKQEGKSIGLVPTMGFLHEGHQSLMARAKTENDKIVVSIFVNPMQFGPKEDLASYPRDLEQDLQRCDNEGVDVIFHPEASEMYGIDFSSSVDVTGLTEELCGKSRPGTLRGMHRRIKTVQYCSSRSRLLWSKGCPTAGGYPSHGLRYEY